MRIIKNSIIIITFLFVLVACNTNNKVRVTFNYANGSVPKVESIDKGAKIEQPADPIYEGYVFEYWTLNDERFSFDTKIEEDIVLVAKWTEDNRSFTVNFDSYGSETVGIGKKVTRPVDPTKAGHTFVNWYDNEDFSGEAFDFNTPINSNINLYALFNVNQYTVTFKTEFGETIDVVSVDYSKKVTKPYNPELNDFVFDNWYVGDTLFDFNTPITKEYIVIAKFYSLGTKYEVTFVNNNETEDTVELVDAGSNVSIPNISKTGYHLIAWYLDEDFEVAYDFNNIVLEDITLYARWGKEFTERTTYSDAIHRGQLSDDPNFNNAERVGLEPSYFHVVSQKGTTGNNVGIYLELRFYANTAATFTMHESFVISSMKVVGITANFVITVDGVNIPYNEINNINGNHIFIKNNSTTTTNLAYIEFTYYQVGPDVVKEDDINRPKFDFGEDNLIIKNVGDTFNVPQYDATDVEDDIIEGIVDMNKSTIPNPNLAGIYYIHYYAIDSDENITYAYITVIYREANLLDNYYASLGSLTGSALITAISNLNKTKLNIRDYGLARDVLEIADRDPNRFENVWLIYDSKSIQGRWQPPNYDREHVWAKSMFGGDHSITSGKDGTGKSFNNDYKGAASDIHNLRAITESVNSSHGNSAFNGIIGEPFGKYGSFYYPGDEHIGDVARIIFYMMLTWDITPREDISMLVAWHLADPVDNFEIIRNEVIFGYQANRNPFIDFPELVERAFVN